MQLFFCFVFDKNPEFGSFAHAFLSESFEVLYNNNLFQP